MRACLLFYHLRNLKLFIFANALSKGDHDLHSCSRCFDCLRFKALVKCILVRLGLYYFTEHFVCLICCTFHSPFLFILSKIELSYLVLGYHLPPTQIHLRGQSHLEFSLFYYPLRFQRFHRNFQLKKLDKLPLTFNHFHKI